MYKEVDGILGYYCPNCDGRMFFFAPTEAGFTIVQPSQIAVMKNVKPIIEGTANPMQYACKECHQDLTLNEIEDLLEEMIYGEIPECKTNLDPTDPNP